MPPLIPPNRNQWRDCAGVKHKFALYRDASPGPFSCTGDVVVGDRASDLAFGQRTD